MKTIKYLLFFSIFSSLSLLAASPTSLLPGGLLKGAGKSFQFEIQKDKVYQVVKKIRIFSSKSSGTKSIQELKVDNFSGVSLQSKIPFKVIDLDEDGFDDIVLLVETRANGADYQYFIYSKKEKRYVSLGVFPELKRIKNTSRFEAEEKISRDEVEYKTYKLEGDKLHLVERSNTKN